MRDHVDVQHWGKTSVDVHSEVTFVVPGGLVAQTILETAF
jgi:hypothetical protein